MPKKAKKTTYNLNQKIKSALRKIWLWSPMRREALQAAVISRRKEVKNGRYMSVVAEFHCAGCNRVRDAMFGSCNVDHITPVADPDGGADWDAYITRLFVSSKGLQVLCKPCHDAKTEMQRNRKKELTKLKNVAKDNKND